MSTADNYEILCELMYEDEIPITKYQSKKTGMKICICEVEGPLIHGNLMFATEAHDDDGLPHTLEHLTFMGSELYPYKGVLDLLANRCLASGTNASTSVDYTNYTMSTVGSEGFLNLLPIYLDHVLYPTLTNEAFLTEVHHINGQGEDAGVVYCEMQARENTGDSICYYKMNQAIYPGECGFKSETGGRLKNLRESTTDEKIQEYHRQFYRPENLCVIIIGTINANDLFEALSPVEEKIVEKGTLPEFTRPWQNPVPPLTQPAEITVPYPCDDCDYGIVKLGWRGPFIHEFEECTALETLSEYIGSTCVSPLQREFVEISEPYCSGLSMSLIENLETVITLNFDNVVKEKFYDVKSRCLEIFTKLATGEENFDMKRISTIIHNSKLFILNQMEKSEPSLILSTITIDFLYGENNSQLEERIKSIQTLDSLKDKDVQFWQNLLEKYFLVDNIVTIIGEPSPELKEKMEEEEKARISKQREYLGDEGLKLKEEELEEAKRKHDIKPPTELIESLPIPSVDKIKFYSIKRLCNYIDDPESNEILHDMPCAFHLDQMNTKFVTMIVLMDTNILPMKLRYYIPIYLNILNELPVERNGELISYEEIVTELDADTVEFGTMIGSNTSSTFQVALFSQLFAMYLKVEEAKYEKGISWIHELLYKTQFTTDRIQVYVNKELKKITKWKRYGSVLLNSLDDLVYNTSSNFSICNMLRQNKFLKKIQQLLETSPNEVIDDLEELRKILTAPENILIHMAANPDTIGPNSLDNWKKLVETPQEKPFSRHKIVDYNEYLLPLSTSVSRSCIIGIGSEESSYFIQITRCMVSDKHPDYPALLVLISYLTQLEGPLWCAIRGPGLSYNFRISLMNNSGLLVFLLTRCTATISAYKAARTCINDLINGDTEWDQSLLESGRSSLVYEIIGQYESSVPTVSLTSLLFYYQDLDMDFPKLLIKEIFEVTLNDIQNMGKKYLTPLFDTTTSTCGICCHSSKVEEIVSGFKEMGRDLNIVDDLDNSFLSNLDESLLDDC